MPILLAPLLAATLLLLHLCFLLQLYSGYPKVGPMWAPACCKSSPNSKLNPPLVRTILWYNNYRKNFYRVTSYYESRMNLQTQKIEMMNGRKVKSKRTQDFCFAACVRLMVQNFRKINFPRPRVLYLSEQMAKISLALPLSKVHALLTLRFASTCSVL